jgi:hypothetical protein
MTFWQSFVQLPVPTGVGSYTVNTSSERVRTARAFNGNAALLIAFEHHASSTSRRLLNFSYTPPAIVELVSSDGSSRTEEFAILECHSSDEAIQRYFFQMAHAVLTDHRAAENEEHFERALDKLVTLFRALRRPAIRSVQGVWAELALICWARFPAVAISAWHSAPRALHDFANGDFKLEVKSSQLRLREHHFRLAQLSAIQTGDTIVASVLLTSSERGASVHNLVAVLEDNPDVTRESIARVETILAETLGAEWHHARDVQFDLSQARESLLFYNARDIPSLPQPLPSGVKDVQFVVDLSNTAAVSLEELRARAPFYKSILPKV